MARLPRWTAGPVPGADPTRCRSRRPSHTRRPGPSIFRSRWRRRGTGRWDGWRGTSDSRCGRRDRWPRWPPWNHRSGTRGFPRSRAGVGADEEQVAGGGHGHGEKRGRGNGSREGIHVPREHGPRRESSPGWRSPKAPLPYSCDGESPSPTMLQARMTGRPRASAAFTTSSESVPGLSHSSSQPRAASAGSTPSRTLGGR